MQQTQTSILNFNDISNLLSSQYFLSVNDNSILPFIQVKHHRIMVVVFLRNFIFIDYIPFSAVDVLHKILPELKK